MNSYNLTNLDIAAKKALEEILRPSAFKVVEPWLAQATQKQKKQILFVQGIGRMVFTDIKATGPNAYGKAAILAQTKASVDAGQNDFYIRRTNSEVINRPQRHARDHFRDYEPVQTNNAVQRYFICDQDGPAAQPFSKVLKPKVVQQLDQWQVFGSATPQMKADVCAVLRTVEMQYSSMPTYFTMLGETPEMERGPFLFEFSKRHQTYASRRADSLQRKLYELQRTSSEPTLHEREYMKDVALIERPGGDIPELMDEPRIQYQKAIKAASQCKINFAGGSTETVSTYQRHYPRPPMMSLLGPQKKSKAEEGMMATFS